MSFRNTSTTYGSVAKFFHWLIFILVFFMIILGYFLDDIPKEYKGSVINVHKWIGLTILTLMILRAAWALTNPKPVLPGITAPWEKSVERSVHLLLYLVIIAMPLSGWIGSTAAGKAPHLGSLTFALPWIETSKPLAHSAFDTHSLLAITIIVLVSLHVFAALYHYFIKKDDVLRRMMPNQSK